MVGGDGRWRACRGLCASTDGALVKVSGWVPIEGSDGRSAGVLWDSACEIPVTVSSQQVDWRFLSGVWRSQ